MTSRRRAASPSPVAHGIMRRASAAITHMPPGSPLATGLSLPETKEFAGACILAGDSHQDYLAKSAAA